MRTIVVAVAILSACFMQEVSGAFLSATPKKEAKVDLKETQEAGLHRGEVQKLQQVLLEASKAGENDLQEEDEEEEQDEEQDEEQGEERGSRRNQEDEEDDQGEEQDLDVDEEHMSEPLKKLAVKAKELHEIADKEGASEEARVAAHQAENEFDKAEAKEAREINKLHLEEHMSEPLKKLAVKAEELHEIADKEGASEEARVAAHQAKSGFDEAEAQEFREVIGKIHLVEEMQEDEQAAKAQVEVAATSQSIMALLHLAEDLAEEAQKVGASDAAKKAAAQAFQDFAEADAKAHLP